MLSQSTLQMMLFINPFKRLWILSISLDVLISVLALSIPLLLKVIFDYGLPLKDLGLIIHIMGFGFILHSLFFLGRSIQRWVSLYVSQSLFRRLYTAIFLKLNHAPLTKVNHYTTGDLMYRITDDSQAVEELFITFIPNVTKLVVKVVVVAAICFWMNPLITAISLCGVPIYVVIQRLFTSKLKHLNELSKKQGSAIYNFLQERLNMIKLIKLHRKSNDQNKRLQQFLTGYYFIEKKEMITQLANQFLTSHFHQLWMAIMGVMMASMTITGSLSLGELMVMSVYISSLIRPFKSLPSLMHAWKGLEVSIQRVDELLQLQEEVNELGGKWPLTGGITIKDVTFAYPGKVPIFNHLNLNIIPNETVAIVGRSGIGKSSLVDMLLRFQDVKGGEILLDGNTINKFSVAYIRKQIGLISADAPLLNTTIEQNIAFSLDEDDFDISRIVAASKLAGAHEFISNLSNGYQTIVGPNGNSLSSGQRQRIAIARTLVQDPQILIFDEATSTLDSESEHVIQQTIFKLKNKKTMILIAHRLSSLELVDRVCVMGSEGTITEQGTISELLDQRGVFYRLYHMQMGGLCQFQKQLKQRLVELKYHAHQLSIALIQSNFDNVSATLTPQDQSQLIHDINLTLSYLLPDVAACFVKENNEWLVLLPGHGYLETQTLLYRLEDYLNGCDFKGLTFTTKSVECKANQSVTQCLSILEEENRVTYT